MENSSLKPYYPLRRATTLARDSAARQKSFGHDISRYAVHWQGCHSLEDLRGHLECYAIIYLRNKLDAPGSGMQGTKGGVKFLRHLESARLLSNVSGSIYSNIDVKFKSFSGLLYIYNWVNYVNRVHCRWSPIYEFNRVAWIWLWKFKSLRSVWYIN